jgi:hypothetical protein
MRSTCLAALVCVVSFSALAQTAPPTGAESPRDRMKGCNAQSKAQSLKGAERKAFLSGCLKGEASAAPVQPGAAATPTSPTSTVGATRAPTTSSPSAAGRLPTSGQTAERDRMKRCGAEWRADKAAGKAPAGQTWPKYWSACNARLKGG